MAYKQANNFVFNTPKTYHASSAGSGLGKLRSPTPSKWDMMKEQLGISDDDVLNSDSDNSSDEYESKGTARLSKEDAEALRRELEEKDRQREDLILQVKTFRENAKKYRARCEKEQANKWQQIKIMRKTHESHLDEKRQLIRNLQDIIEEQEGRIYEVESELKGNNSPTLSTSTLSDPVQKLAASLDRLQTEMASIREKQLTAEHQLVTLDQDHENEKRGIHDDMTQLRSELNDAQVMIRTLRSGEPIPSGTDNEKEIAQLKQELQRYEAELLLTKAMQEEVVQQQTETSHRDAALLKKFESENTRLKDRILELEADVATKTKIMAESEVGHKKQQHRLEKAVREQAVRLKAVELEFDDLKSHPQMVEVTKTITVDSEEAKKALVTAKERNRQLKTQLTTLRETCDATEQQLRHSKTHIQALQEKLKEQDSQMALLDQSMQEVAKRADVEVAEARRQGEEKAAALNQRFTAMRAKFTLIRPGLVTIAQEYQQLRSLCAQFPSMLKAAIEQTKKEISVALLDLTEYNKVLVQKYHHEMALRKKYHNEIIDLKGSIRVFCRVRPIISEDGSGPLARSAVSFDDDDNALLYLQNKGRSTTFEVDKVFQASSTQEQVFKEVQPLVESSIDGYNVCIFAYGQTGSGKTFTMEGSATNPGINQRALQHLFEETSSRGEEWDYTISVSVMEIYNETLRDLLSDDPQVKLEIKMNPDGSGLYVPGLCEIEVNSVDDINEVFQMGRRNRATATTDMNEHSSRSHALLCVKIIGKNKTSGKRNKGKLNLVDLAGSERVNKSGSSTDTTRMKEAQSINKSLSSLGDVIYALRSKQGHIPYRNSKLTYLLQESLGGDSKTLMVVQISPVNKNVSESQCSLSFAQRVRAVELGAASKKIEAAEVVVLKERLAAYEDGCNVGVPLITNKEQQGYPNEYTRNSPTITILAYQGALWLEPEVLPITE